MIVKSIVKELWNSLKVNKNKVIIKKYTFCIRDYQNKIINI